jgi:hypothetical protein
MKTEDNFDVREFGKESPMKVINSRDTLAAIPAHMARAIRRIAGGVIKRLLRAALVAEGELEPTPRPIGNDLVKVFGRIDTGAIDDVA